MPEKTVWELTHKKHANGGLKITKETRLAGLRWNAVKKCWKLVETIERKGKRRMSYIEVRLFTRKDKWTFGLDYQCTSGYGYGFWIDETKFPTRDAAVVGAMELAKRLMENEPDKKEMLALFPVSEKPTGQFLLFEE